jgi:hypothetical protein
MKKLRKVSLDKPFLLTFRRRVQKGKYAGQYLFRMVASIPVVESIGTRLKILAIEEKTRDQQTMWWFFRQPPDPNGYAALNPLYLQTIDEFPDNELPLLLGWQMQYPGLGPWITTRLTTPA